eukprot:Phypoly_transcript_04457.p1 GENE.Phypoly_transcript_04457~~Phypoly_transcript_04457.p1  ORF type:complete len:692 (+),score=126.44 Phypoly_transcript_04457:282-2078(+)
MAKRGNTLIAVPCWWDKSLESLAATVRLKRRDLLKEYANVPAVPIPPEPPPGFFKVDAVPNFGEVMLASNPSSPFFDPTFWWLSEKHDGVRSFFNPRSRTLHSRTGKTQTLPIPFYSVLPNVVIDGELWFGRGNFLESHKISSSPELQKSIDWAFLRIVAFDSPDLERPISDMQKDLAELAVAEADAKIGGEKLDQNAIKGRNEDVKIEPEEAKRETAEFEGNSERVGGSAEVAIGDAEIAEGDAETIGELNEGRKKPEFETRYLRLLTNVGANPVVEIAANVFCESRAMLHNLLNKILEAAGEGMVARKNRSIYVHGRSDLLLKFKSNRDQEGLVIEKKGMVYTLKLPSNETIKAVRSNMEGIPKIGELVTFVYFHHSKKTGSPTWAQIQVVRHDMSWQEAVYNFRFSTLPRQPQVTTTSHSILRQTSPRASTGYFTVGSSGNIRKFFDAFARARNLDPLKPESWYSVTAAQIEAVKHGYAVVKHYNRSVSSMLMDTYPDIGLEKSKFRNKPQKYWDKVSNQRILFEQLARDKGFDPLLASTWYSHRRDDFRLVTAAKHVMEKYDSYRHCVKTMFPELDLVDRFFVGFKPKKQEPQI